MPHMTQFLKPHIIKRFESRLFAPPPPPSLLLVKRVERNSRGCSPTMGAALMRAYNWREGREKVANYGDHEMR